MLEAFGQTKVSRFGARDLAALAGLLFLTLALVASSLPTRELWHRDEARFATIARTMHERGDLLVPHLGEELYQDKPPLLFWLMDLSALALGGFSDVAVRLPGMVASVLCVLGTYMVGSFFFGRRAALLGGVVLATSVLYLMTSQFALTDPVLICLQTWALYCFIRGEYSPGRGRGLAWYLGFYVLAALATLTKGPIGLLVPGAVLAVWVVCRRGLRDLGRVRLHWGILLYLAIVAAWLVPAGLQAGWAYAKYLLLNQTFWRVRSSRYSTYQPWHFYLWTYFLFAWPWALFVPEALVRAARRWWVDRGDAERSRCRQGLLLVVVWFVVVMSGWSVAGVKRERYVLFAYPAAALAVGWFWSAVLSKRERWAWTTGLAAALCAVTVLVAAVAMGIVAVPSLGEWAVEHAPGHSSVPADDRVAGLVGWRIGFGVLAVSLLAVAVGLAWCLRGRRRWALPWVALAPVALQVHAAVWVFPMMNTFVSVRPVAEVYRELLVQHPRATVTTHDLFWTAIGWYSGNTDVTRIERPKDVLDLLGSQEQAFVLMEASHLEKLRGHLPRLGDFPRRERKAGARRIVILSNRPEADLSLLPEGVPPSTSETSGRRE